MSHSLCLSPQLFVSYISILAHLIRIVFVLCLSVYIDLVFILYFVRTLLTFPEPMIS